MKAPTGVGSDPFRHGDKHRSWNDFGAAYWALAGTSSHPSALESAQFLAGAGCARVLVLGATTTELTQTALDTGAEVHVADFADKLLALVTDRFNGSVTIHHHDILKPAPPHLTGRFDVVVADRLLNRFHRSEMPVVLANMMSFVGTSGTLRISVRFGLYPLDRQLIARGRQLGTLARFWDEGTQTLDWTGVGREIEDVAEPNGEISAEVVVAWSRLRGVESRLQPDEMPLMVREAGAAGTALRIAEMLDMDVAPDSKTYVLTHEAAPVDAD